MKVVRLELPDRLAEDIKSTDSEHICQLLELGIRQMKMENALVFLKKGGVSIGYAAKIAGVREDEMSLFAYANGLESHFTKESLKEDIG